MTPGDVDFPRTARRILLVAAVLAVAGSVYFYATAAVNGLLSFAFGSVISIALLALLARTLLLLDVTGEGGNTPRATQALLVMGQFALFGAVYVAVERFPIHVNATACGFAVGIVAATLEQGVSLLWPKSSS